MTFLNVGNHGWQIDDMDPVDEQQEKIDAIVYATERLLRTLKEVVGIYAKYGNQSMFRTFENAVSEAMQKGKYENYFNDKNYKENSDQ